MEIVVYPRAFSVQPGQIGDKPVVAITAEDTSGNAVRLVFGPRDWEAFQEFVADPAGAQARAAARAQIQVVGGMSGSVKKAPKH